MFKQKLGTSARNSTCHVYYFHSSRCKGQVRLCHVKIMDTGVHWLGATTCNQFQILH